MRTTWLLTLCFALTNCGGGAGGGAPIPTTSQVRTASVTIIIPGASSPQSGTRGPRFVSPGVNGAQVLIYAQSDTTHASPLVSASFDLSSGSKFCTISTPRSCTLPIGLPVGADTITATLYNEAPVSGVFASAAKPLGIGSQNQNVAAGSAPLALTVTVAPIVGSVSLTQPTSSFLSLSSGQGPQKIPLVISALDEAGFPVSGIFATPLLLTLSENGGSNHSVLSLNGAPGVSSVLLTASTDSASFTYDGNGTAGYGATVTINLQGSSVVLYSQVFSPIFVGSTSSFFNAATNSVTLNGPGSSLTLTATEVSAPTATFSQRASTNCSGAVTLVSGSPGFMLQGGTAASSGACTVTVADASGASVILAVANTIGPSPSPPPTPAPNPLSVSPTSLTFIASGAAYAQSFTATESGYSGAFIESDNCHPGTGTIATVSPSSGTGPSTIYTVTPQTSAGSCSITLHDSNGQSATVNVSVSLAQGVIN